MSQPTGDMPASEPARSAEQPIALILCTDLMFSVQLQRMARSTGYKDIVVRPGAGLPAANIMIADLGARGDWAESIREAAGQGIPVVAFGPHMDAEARRRARGAGASRVLANSNLARDLPGILLANLEGNSGQVPGSEEDTAND